ncbi:MAG TPA: lysylphosphatidylglycerol synthase domain-containing protein [Chitinophaga sp.]|uniref:lysylphosphatidylglycerol synthase domain-containing protein n=1 Tax=Chitinophaga sp. TaxID=1869181 RepID=UPI002DBFCB1D|nr:lysylphosphatidylglycerol synthase domain-containing protein [Chitinophaga sp.]HEU4554867.1 lysylphosphatidylglycerol synthase domain-containing protein [Chitinophaga sp.]
MLVTLRQKGGMALTLVFVLMIFNWGLEARKWQLLVRSLEAVSFLRAFSAVLSGVSLSINTPNRIGEYGGRMLYMSNQNKLKSIAATMIGSLSQLIITIIFGLTGLIYYVNNFPLAKANSYPAAYIWEKILLVALALIGVLAIILYFRLQIVITIFEKIPVLRKAKVFMQIITRYTTADLQYLLLLSACRYVVFSAQYLILLNTFGVEMLWWQGFLLNAVIYLVMAVVPTIAVVELGLRGKVSIYFLGLLSDNTAAIIAATVGIWLVNLLLPAVLGSILLLGVKIFKDK